MIFDHGCDAFNSFLNAMAISRLFNVSLFTQAAAVVLVTAVFWFATLEQHFTDYFYLGRVNNVNEGIVFLFLLACFGGVFGGGVWLEAWVFGIKNWKICMAVLFLSSQGTVLNHIYTMLEKGHAGQKIFQKTFQFIATSLILLITVWNFHCRADFYIFGFIFTKTTVQS